MNAVAVANRIALQQLINAYLQETGRGCLIPVDEQTRAQLALSGKHTLLWLCLEPFSITVAVPLEYASSVGRHRFASLPCIWRDYQWRQASPVTLAALVLEDVVHNAENNLDASGLLERWVQSRDALAVFLKHRTERLDELTQLQQSFKQSEQALLLGHNMHPASKSRQGFMHDEFLRYSPETQGEFALHFWLVHPDILAEGHAEEGDISSLLCKSLLQADAVPASALQTMAEYPQWKLLPLHPWQARFLMGQPLWRQLTAASQAISLGAFGWTMHPTTSVRTLVSDAPWMFKPSLSVAITNSVRINLAHECLRGEISCRLWRSAFGVVLKEEFPTLAALNDPGWLGIKLNGQLVSESICILRENPFTAYQQITCMASLCQDHPLTGRGRLHSILSALVQRTAQPAELVAMRWLERFLDIAVGPLLTLYARYGMAFEAHQQNTLLELDDLWPGRFWLRDNQGFYYIRERAGRVLAQFPELGMQADSVGPESFVEERFIYYFFGNTLFGLIGALGGTGLVDEGRLLYRLREFLHAHRQLNPGLIQALLSHDTLPFKGNLLTRLHGLDELVAPLDRQSVYVQVRNPLRETRTEVASA
ncbi:siderophore biosynthesis protein [Pseudomonas sp. gcc21]|uniref:IucA/IucC family protein n=1 Tax=Pseudomonas sp. gcc21 TaxID=2726989 RepID=UPI001451C74D|nr:IucA/IucC family protein [Pseudomonas sp. gcc21]QJD58248.1 siderophore biosynthesis protein [Pseudomonas sp. gcc21]